MGRPGYARWFRSWRQRCRGGSVEWAIPGAESVDQASAKSPSRPEECGHERFSSGPSYGATCRSCIS